MFKKTLTILAVIFIGQFVTSCFWGCNCKDIEDTLVEYEDVNIQTYDTSSRPDYGEDSVFKYSFGINVNLSTNAELSGLDYFQNNMGFSCAMACSCIDRKYLYDDPIAQVTLLAVVPEMELEKDVTKFFRKYIYERDYEELNLLSVLNNKYELIDEFQFEIHEEDSIPNSAIFRVEVHLESGAVLSDGTDRVNFYNR